MGLFRDADEMYEFYAALFDLLGKDSQKGLRLANAGLVIQFRLSDPDGIVTLNMRNKPMRRECMWIISSGNVLLNQTWSSRIPPTSLIDFSRGKSILFGH